MRRLRDLPLAFAPVPLRLLSFLIRTVNVFSKSMFGGGGGVGGVVDANRASPAI